LTANPEDFVALADAVSDELYEREDEARAMIQGLAGGLNIFMYGLPGVAKSKVVARSVARIAGLDRGDYFYRNLSKWTKDTNIFGGPHLGKMQTLMDNDGNIVREGVYQRNTKNKMPEATIVMLDEIWNASDALVNALLLATNEGLFEDEELGLIEIPTVMFAAAANSMPEDQDRQAIWDRFEIRLITEPLAERANQRQMLEGAAVDRLEIPPEPVLHIADIREANSLVPKVHVPPMVLDAMMQIRHELTLQNIKPSDRRWARSVRLVQTEAWLSGADEVTIEHLAPLRHMLWNRMIEVDPVSSVVLSIASADEATIYKTISDLRKVQPRIDKLSSMDEDDLGDEASELFSHVQKIWKRSEKVRSSIQEGGGSEKLETQVGKMDKLYKSIVSELNTKGFGND
jgi:MoxR-like ATPase